MSRPPPPATGKGGAGVTRYGNLWTPDNARKAIDAALDLTAEIEPPDDLRVAVFGAAVQLLTTVVPIAGTDAIPLARVDDLLRRKH
jgi:hypothetical protein